MHSRNYIQFDIQHNVNFGSVLVWFIWNEVILRLDEKRF